MVGGPRVDVKIPGGFPKRISKRYARFMLRFVLALWPLLSFANPYPDPKLVHSQPIPKSRPEPEPVLELPAGLPVTRIQVDWAEGETYLVGKVVGENSGTAGLARAALKPDPYGSYRAEFTTGGRTYHDALGTGKEFRKLVRGLTFRFPVAPAAGSLKVWAENPESGVMELVLEQDITAEAVEPVSLPLVEVRPLRSATQQPSLLVSIYAEGYEASRKERFFQRAQAVVDTLARHLPGHERLSFQAVFAPSATRLGSARNLGPVPVRRDSFLGLYFPHWNAFGRWYHVVYATDQHQYRTGLASAPYDHPIILIDSSEYWGVGNYKELTAIPAESGQFSYLLLHEYGHYLGLNEEYSFGGRTELEFAPGIREPWSPNITFHPRAGELKWESLVPAGTPLPTPRGHRSVGAFAGGYAESPPLSASHKPVQDECVMNAGGPFCPVCAHAVRAQLAKDVGE